MPRHQKLYVIRCDLEQVPKPYYNGKAGWTDRLELACVYPAHQVDRVINIDIGLPCQKIEIEPHPVLLGGAADA